MDPGGLIELMSFGIFEASAANLLGLLIGYAGARSRLLQAVASTQRTIIIILVIHRHSHLTRVPRYRRHEHLLMRLLLEASACSPWILIAASCAHQINIVALPAAILQLVAWVVRSGNSWGLH